MTQEKRAKIAKYASKTAAIAAAAVITFIILFPLLWIVPSAFKPRSELFSIPNHFFSAACNAG